MMYIWLIASVIGWMIYRTILSRSLYRRALEAKNRGCQPPPNLIVYRPWGLDYMEQLIRAHTQEHVMEFLLYRLRTLGQGTTMQQTILGKTLIITAEQANIEAILNSSAQDWGLGLRRKIMDPFLGNGIFTQDGQEAKNSRKLLQPQFKYSQYENLEKIEKTIRDLFTVLPSKGPCNLKPFFFQLTLDTTTDFLFGESVHSLKSAHHDQALDFATAFNTAQDYMTQRVRFSSFYWPIGKRKFKKACDTVHMFADKIIERNLSRYHTNSDTNTFLHLVYKNCQDRTVLRSQIINILLAGRDTTACLLTWTFFLLVRHPFVLDKLKREIKTFLAQDKQVTRTTLREMTYLQNVITEVLRLYPPVPVNQRTAIRDTVLPIGGGPKGTAPVFVQKGDECAYSVYMSNRQPDFYGMDASIFRPERFDEKIDNERWKELLPFNGGKRTCLGMDFARTETALVVFRILQKYPNLSLPEGEKLEALGVEKQNLTLVLSSKHCCVNLGR